MNIHELPTLKIDLKDNYVVEAVCKQLDDLILSFEIYNSYIPIDLSSFDIELRALKSDKVPVIQDTDIVITNNKLKIKCNPQLTISSGVVKAELECIDKITKEKKFSFDIEIEVKPSVLEVNRSISTPTCTLMERLEKDLDKVRDLEFNFNEANKINKELKDTTIPNANKINTTLEENTKKAITSNTNLKDSTNAANTAKQAIDSSVVQANASKQALDTSKLNADNTKKEVDNSIKIADEKIEIIKNLDPENVVEDVKNLKKQVLENTLTSITTDSALTKLDNSENGFVRNMQIKGKTRYKKADGTYSDTWENGVNLESVGEIEGNKISILSTGKNLCPANLQNHIVTSSTVYDNYPIKVKKNTNYSIKIRNITALSGSELQIKSQDKKTNLAQFFLVDNQDIEKTFNTETSDYIYIRGYKSTGELRWGNVQLEEGTIATAYEEYKEDKTEILLSNEPLRGLPNGVGDIVDFDKGEIIRNVGKTIFDGTESGWNVEQNFTDKLGLYISVKNKAQTGRNNIISNKFAGSLCSTVIGDNHIEGIFHEVHYDVIRVGILKSKLETPDVNGFKKWLQANPTTAYYQLTTPVVEKLNIKDTLQTFQDGYIQLDNAITPFTSLEYSTNIPSAIGGLTRVVDHNVDEITNIESTISDMDAEIGEARKGKTTLEERLEEDRTNILKTIGNVNVESDGDLASQLKENTQYLTQLSNPNLLINGDFQIWQRGEGFDYIGSIDGKKNIYTADRWRIVQSHDTPKCNIYKYKDANGVYFGLNNLYKPQDVMMTIHQKLEPFYLVSGKYTLSFEYANTGNVEFNARVYSFKKNQNIECSERCIPNHSETWSKCKMTFDIDNTNIQDVIEISFDLFGDYNNDGIFYLRRVKLELGSVATPFVPRPYTEEEMLCKRYYKKINLDGITFLSSGENIAINTFDNIKMRTHPTVKFDNEKAFLHTIGEEQPINLSPSSLSYNWGGYYGLEIHASIKGLKGNNACTINQNSNAGANVSNTVNLLLDSEIY